MRYFPTEPERNHQQFRESNVVRPLNRLIKKIANLFGYDIRRISNTPFTPPGSQEKNWDTFGLNRIQYACGPKFLKDWVNVDFYPPDVMKTRFKMPGDIVYFQADLGLRQPFGDETFSFAYTEDFIEHLSQADSIIFLNECYRVLKESGVLRMSFPGLDGVLMRHFNAREYKVLAQGKRDAFDQFQHIHFYSREELSLVAHHIGFSSVRFVEYGQSDYEPLQNRETRDRQQDLNIYVELIK